MDLNYLTEAERDVIVSVLRRDDTVRQADKLRVNKLKTELHQMRLKSVIHQGETPTRTCARCRADLGLIFGRGDLCPKCHQRVCFKCQLPVARATKNSSLTWLCSLCHKQAEIDLLSGDWMKNFLEPRLRQRTRSGGDLVRQSMRKVMGKGSRPALWAHDHSEESDPNFKGAPRAADTNRLQQLHADKGQRRGSDSSSTEEEIISPTSMSFVALSGRGVIRHRRSVSDSPSFSSVDSARDSPQSSFRGRKADSGTQAKGSSSIDQAQVTSHGVKKADAHVSTSTSPAAAKSPLQPSSLSGGAAQDSQLSLEVRSSSGTFSDQERRENESLKSRASMTSLRTAAVSEPTLQASPSQQTQQSPAALDNGPITEENLAEIQTESSTTNSAANEAKSLHSSEKGEASDAGQLRAKSSVLNPTLSMSTESVSSSCSVPEDNESAYNKVAVSGMIQFAAHYKEAKGQLEVLIVSCQGLAAVDARRKRSDPYVKTHLLPDHSAKSKRKTSVKRHTLNPTFNATLKYSVPHAELAKRSLLVSVWHSDRLGHNVFLGEVTQPMNAKTLAADKPEWYTLTARHKESSVNSSITGELHLSLCYTPSEEDDETKTKRKRGKKSGAQLLVKVSSAQNLAPTKSRSANVFVKGHLLPDKKTKQKTAGVRNDCNPQWNDTLTFDMIGADGLAERCMELAIWNTANEILGGVRCNLGTGQASGQPCGWMDGKGNEVELWQNLSTRSGHWIDGTLPLRQITGGGTKR